MLVVFMLAVLVTSIRKKRETIQTTKRAISTLSPVNYTNNDTGSEEMSETNILIAIGEFVSLNQERNFSFAKCKIQTVLKGHVETNVVAVTFFPSTLNGSLPHSVILVLTPTPTLWMYNAIGNDASRGFIVDNPENRRRVTTVSADELAPVPMTQRLTEEMARGIVEAYVADHHSRLTNAIWRLTRMGYEGWSVMPFGWKDDRRWIPDATPSFIVGDDGVIKAELPP
jgi:hypothetical protein